jgi:D-3-phosphoglycerate dehydrogenase
MRKVVKTDGGFLSLVDGDHEVLAGLNARIEELDCSTEEALIENCRDAVALLVLREPITAHVLDHLTECKVVARFGVGLDTIDIDAATKRGIRVTNVPDANASEVATHALAMILSLVRRLPQFDRATRRADWKVAEIGRGMRRVEQLVLGIVGLGRTGSRLAVAGSAVGFKVIAADPFASDDAIRSYGAQPVTFDHLIESADVVSLHVPLTADTKYLISREVIGIMKSGAILVNVARGGLVDEAALLDALSSNALAGAGLDTFEREPLPTDSFLLAAENLILSPHAAHYSLEANRETIRKAFEDVARVLRGESPEYPVN